ncbi:MAG: transaldolase [Desulfobacterales bacterium]
MKEKELKAIQRLQEPGQGIWLDHITRDLLTSGKFERYIAELPVTGLTTSPDIFDRAITNSSVYDGAIRKKLKADRLGEDLYYDLVLEDIRRAADLLRPLYEQTGGVDGWVSLEMSPLLDYNTEYTLALAKDLYARLQRPNLLVKIPGTTAGLPAVEEAIFAGVPVNVTRLFSHEHYLAAAGAFLRGVERRIAAGLEPNVGSVASMSVSRWDAAVRDRVPDSLRNTLGVAVARCAYKACRDLLNSSRWQRAHSAGARPQRLLWVDTQTVDPATPDDFYIRALAAPFAVITLSERTLKAFMDCGDSGELMPVDGGDCEALLARFAASGIDVDTLSAELQDEGASSAIKSWIELMSAIAAKSAALAQGQSR